MRTRPPTLSTVPSISESTPSSRAIFGIDARLPLYRTIDCREMTRSDRMPAIWEIKASVMPSEKYSSSSWPERLTSGNTASDDITGGLTGTHPSGGDGAGVSISASIVPMNR